MKKSIMILSTIFQITVFAQPSILWQNEIGGNDSDSGNSIVKTADGGAIVGGSTNSNDIGINSYHGQRDALITKYTSNGSIEWQKCYGGTNDDRISKIISSIEGGYVFIGYTKSNDGDVSGNHGGINKLDFLDFWIVKISVLGSIEWQKCIGGTGADVARDVIQTSDGNYIVAGDSYSSDGDLQTNFGGPDYFITKISNTGNVIWKKSYGGSGWDYAQSLSVNTSNEIIVVGRTTSSDNDVTGFHGGQEDAWVLKLNNFGNIIWKKCYGGMGGTQFTSVIFEGSNSFLIGATSVSDGDVSINHGWSDIWLVKVDANGTIIWEKTIGGTYSEHANAVIMTADNNLVICGSAKSNDQDFVGNTNIWNNFTESEGNGFLAKISLDGTLQWVKFIGDSNHIAEFYSITENSQGEIFTTGYIAPITTFEENMLTLKFSNQANLNELNNGFDLKIFPNPSSTHISINTGNFALMNGYSIKIENVIGQTVFSSSINAASFYVDLSNWTGNGVYLLHIKNSQGNDVEVRKIVLQH